MSPSRSGTQSHSGELDGPLCLALVQFFRVDHTLLVGHSESGNRGAQKNAWMLRSASMVPLGTTLFMTGEGEQSRNKPGCIPQTKADYSASQVSKVGKLPVPACRRRCRHFLIGAASVKNGTTLSWAICLLVYVPTNSIMYHVYECSGVTAQMPRQKTQGREHHS